MALVSMFLCYCKSQPNASGFTTDLIHRDSPLSPLYDPSLTLEQRVNNARNRSIARSRYFTDILKGTAVSPVSPDGGGYLIQFFMGTPLKQTMAMIDTGSSVIWTQCTPCVSCRPQKFRLFDPKSSFTYKDALCGSPGCTALGNKGFCDANRDKCLYLISYGDGSHSTGHVGSETFTFRSTAGGLLRFPNILFGCGTNNYDKFPNDGSGIVGIGVGPGTLLPQMGYDKFSYCLISLDGSKYDASTLHFGSDAVVSGWGVVSTPMTKLRSYYYLTMEAISVGTQRIPFITPVGGANIIIDSGTALTLLPINFYDDVETAIAKSIEQMPVRDHGGWRLCYTEAFVMPKMTVHFKGADVEWKQENVFVKVDQDYECLALQPRQTIPIFGSVAQVNYMVGYDVTRNTVSFKPTKCGR
ncbi:aspartic proteinase CDR1-like [Salvia splendens]|uniref:aspartic proteinase CDR1-like n=1 Tax=Salvia splendens TaxID=180675 RepID=UPI001C27F790|nr:aspartic proteinase CDR1-like [Salvia splendens]